MLSFLKLTSTFILRVLFNKDEYNFNSNKFNPLKILVVIMLITFPISTVFFYMKLSQAYVVIEKFCPRLAEEITNGVNKDTLMAKLEKEGYKCGK
jgi:hypothetical protein